MYLKNLASMTTFTTGLCGWWTFLKLC